MDLEIEHPDRPDSPVLPLASLLPAKPVVPPQFLVERGHETCSSTAENHSLEPVPSIEPHYDFSFYQMAKIRRAADFLSNFYCPQEAFPLYTRLWNDIKDVELRQDLANCAMNMKQYDEAKQLLHHSLTIAAEVEDMFTTYLLTDELDSRYRGSTITLPMKPLTSYFFDQYVSKLLIPGKRIPSGSLQFFSSLMSAIRLKKTTSPFLTTLQTTEDLILSHFQDFCSGSVQLNNTFTGYCGLKPCIAWCLNQISSWQNPLDIAHHLGTLYGTKEGGILLLYHHLWSSWDSSLQTCPDDHGFDCGVCGWTILRAAEIHLNISPATLLKVFAVMIIEASEHFLGVWSGSEADMTSPDSVPRLVEQVCLGAASLTALSDGKLALRFLQKYDSERSSYHEITRKVDSSLKDFARAVVQQRLEVDVPQENDPHQELMLPQIPHAALQETLAPSLRSSSSASFRSFKMTGMKDLVASLRSSRPNSQRQRSGSSMTIDDLSDTMSSVSIRSTTMVMA
jgi:hypothetical protein